MPRLSRRDFAAHGDRCVADFGIESEAEALRFRPEPSDGAADAAQPFAEDNSRAAVRERRALEEERGVALGRAGHRKSQRVRRRARRPDRAQACAAPRGVRTTLAGRTVRAARTKRTRAVARAGFDARSRIRDPHDSVHAADEMRRAEVVVAPAWTGVRGQERRGKRDVDHLEVRREERVERLVAVDEAIGPLGHGVAVAAPHPAHGVAGTDHDLARREVEPRGADDDDFRPGRRCEESEAGCKETHPMELHPETRGGQGAEPGNLAGPLRMGAPSAALTVPRNQIETARPYPRHRRRRLPSDFPSRAGITLRRYHPPDRASTRSNSSPSAMNSVPTKRRPPRAAIGRA